MTEHFDFDAPLAFPTRHGPRLDTTLKNATLSIVQGSGSNPSVYILKFDSAQSRNDAKVALWEQFPEDKKRIHKTGKNTEYHLSVPYSIAYYIQDEFGIQGDRVPTPAIVTPAPTLPPQNTIMSPTVTAMRAPVKVPVKPAISLGDALQTALMYKDTAFHEFHCYFTTRDAAETFRTAYKTAINGKDFGTQEIHQDEGFSMVRIASTAGFTALDGITDNNSKYRVTTDENTLQDWLMTTPVPEVAKAVRRA